jgi:hypothetical protein
MKEEEVNISEAEAGTVWLERNVSLGREHLFGVGS